MSYNAGQANVFVDLTADAKASTPAQAAVTDTLNTGGKTTIAVDYLGNNADGTPGVQTETITVGTGTQYANTAQGLINAVNGAGLGLTASFTTAGAAGDTAATAATDTGIEITGSVGSGVNASAGSYTGTLTVAGGAAGDTLTGSITLRDGTNPPTTITMGQVAAAEGTTTADMTDLETYINDGPNSKTVASDPFGVVASLTGDVLTLTSVTPATTSPVTPYSTLNVSANLTDTTDTTVANTGLTYTATAGYAVGLNNTATFATTGVADSTLGATANAGFQTDTSATGNIATISYTDAAGQSLATTDLSNQSDAQTALTNLNVAIADVAAQDGYVGAQINTLNSVSSVMSTQQENVESAQNAVQATDYAQASSNMSKYEILSQTGIAALAQANSMQQEVTKLLQ